MKCVHLLYATYVHFNVYTFYRKKIVNTNFMHAEEFRGKCSDACNLP